MLRSIIARQRLAAGLGYSARLSKRFRFLNVLLHAALSASIMLAKDNGGSDDRRDDPSHSGSPKTASEEGGAEGRETLDQPAEPNPERMSAFMQAMFERLEEHARSISMVLREDLRSAQDEFMNRMAAEREQREKAIEEAVTANFEAEIATKVAEAVEARLECDVVVAQREVSVLQESLTAKLAQLESVVVSVESAQRALADPRQLAQEELDRLREEFTVLRADVGVIQGQVEDMRAHVDEAVRTKVRRESQEFGVQQFKAVLEELLERPACRDTGHKELLWNISKQLTRVVSMVLDEDRPDARYLRRRISETMAQEEDDADTFQTPPSQPRMRGRGGGVRHSSVTRSTPRGRSAPRTSKRVGFDRDRRRSSAEPNPSIQWPTGRSVQPWPTGDDSDRGTGGKDEDPDDDPDDEGSNITDGDEVASAEDWLEVFKRIVELQALNAYVPENIQATRAKLDDIERLLRSTATLNAGEAFDSWFDTYPLPTEIEPQGVRSEKQKFGDAGIGWKGHRTVRFSGGTDQSKDKMGILEFMQDLEDYYLAENVLTSGRRIALLFQGIQQRGDLDELKNAIETQERLEGKKLTWPVVRRLCVELFSPVTWQRDAFQEMLRSIPQGTIPPNKWFPTLQRWLRVIDNMQPNEFAMSNTFKTHVLRAGAHPRLVEFLDRQDNLRVYDLGHTSEFIHKAGKANINWAEASGKAQLNMLRVAHDEADFADLKMLDKNMAAEAKKIQWDGDLGDFLESIGVPRAEFDTRMAEKRCAICGDNGHYLYKCPNFQHFTTFKSGRQQPLAQMQRDTGQDRWQRFNNPRGVRNDVNKLTKRGQHANGDWRPRLKRIEKQLAQMAASQTGDSRAGAASHKGTLSRWAPMTTRDALSSDDDLESEEDEEVAHQLNKMSTDELSMWEQMQALQDKVNELVSKNK